jgi:hypothetical protein
MVQAFKKHACTANLPCNKENFNTMLAKERIASEHYIGILEGRFSCLKCKILNLGKQITKK